MYYGILEKCGLHRGRQVLRIESDPALLSGVLMDRKYTYNLCYQQLNEKLVVYI